MKNQPALLTLLLAGMLAAPGTARPQERAMLLNLRGEWLFEIGDDNSWSNPKFNDKAWGTIFAPSPWEDEGYPGYDGYGWYRKHFMTKPDWKERQLYLNLGNIDDADEVYVNGHFIAFRGIFPPHFRTDYSSLREYPLPQWCLNYDGDNVIGIRVYDNEQGGGIVAGKIGIYEQREPLRPAQSLAGKWRIMTGDDFAWKEAGYDDSAWREVHVPAFWETQGLKDYDGLAWYRFRFHLTPGLADDRLILLMGKIDDLDETYLNGERIGRTGTIYTRTDRIHYDNEYDELRAYTIPKGVLKSGEDNLIAVRVYDGFMHGGIYDGPIGIVTRETYLQWKGRNRLHPRTPWDYIREWIR